MPPARLTTPDADALATVVRLHLDGVPLFYIAEELNGQGVPTARAGVRWWPSTVRSMLLSRRGRALIEAARPTRAMPA
jgi:hypothetical protein